MACQLTLLPCTFFIVAVVQASFKNHCAQHLSKYIKIKAIYQLFVT